MTPRDTLASPPKGDAVRALALSLALLLAVVTACTSDSAPPEENDAIANDSPQAIAQLARDWTADLRSLEMRIEVEIQLFGAPARFGMTVAAQGDDSYAVVSTPAASAQEGGPTRLEVLARDGKTFTRDSTEPVWTDVTNEQFWLAGINLDLLAGAAVFDWSALDGVAVTPGRRRGVEVWIVEYTFELSDINAQERGIGGALGPAPALLLRSFDLPTELIGEIAVRTEIARASGAPLYSEIAVALDGPAGLAADRAVVATTELTAWNEPIEFPEADNPANR